MSDSFEERAALQRRQIFHQEQLESKSFRNVWPAGRGGATSNLLGFIVLLMIPLLLLAAALTAVLATTAALPAAFGIVVITRLVWRCQLRRLWLVYLAALSGLLLYVGSALVISIATGFLHSPSATSVFSGQLANALWTLAAHASDALNAFGQTTSPLRQLMGAGFNGDEPMLVRAAALAILHLPGLLACGWAFSYWIGSPFRGFRGRLAAFATAVIVAPASLALTIQIGLLMSA